MTTKSKFNKLCSPTLSVYEKRARKRERDGGGGAQKIVFYALVHIYAAYILFCTTVYERQKY